MRFLLSSGAAFFFALLGVFTAREWWAGRMIARLTAVPHAVSSVEHTKVTKDELRAAPPSVLHPAAVAVALYWRLAEQGREEVDPARRIQLLCEALSEIGKAAHAAPYNAEYLINWASIRQLLGQTPSCALPYTQGSFADVAKAALEADPTNVRVLFAAARIYEWAGQHADSLGRLRQVLQLSTSLGSEQRSYIGGRLQTAQDVEAVIPGRFPQIADWSAYVRSLNPGLFRSAQTEFSRLQLSAIAESRAEVDSGLIPAELHERRLLSLYRAPGGPSVRRRLDHEIAAQSGERGQSQLAQYLRDRQDLDETDVVRAVVPSDTRPLKTPIVHWSPSGEVCFDDFYSSVGFYLPPGQSPVLIELRSRADLDQAVQGTMRVYVSEDNRTWEELQGGIQVRSAKLGETTLISLWPHSNYYKYWKISSNNAVRSRKFCDNPEQLLVVYRSASGGSTL